MFDLLIREAESVAQVPVPLPGRVIVFAGPGGVLILRHADGSFTDAAGQAVTFGQGGGQ